MRRLVDAHHPRAARDGAHAHAVAQLAQRAVVQLRARRQARQRRAAGGRERLQLQQLRVRLGGGLLLLLDRLQLLQLPRLLLDGEARLDGREQARLHPRVRVAALAVAARVALRGLQRALDLGELGHGDGHAVARAEDDGLRGGRAAATGGYRDGVKERARRGARHGGRACGRHSRRRGRQVLGDALLLRDGAARQLVQVNVQPRLGLGRLLARPTRGGGGGRHTHRLGCGGGCYRLARCRGPSRGIRVAVGATAAVGRRVLVGAASAVGALFRACFGALREAHTLATPATTAAGLGRCVSQGAVGPLAGGPRAAGSRRACALLAAGGAFGLVAATAVVVIVVVVVVVAIVGVICRVTAVIRRPTTAPLGVRARVASALEAGLARIAAASVVSFRGGVGGRRSLRRLAGLPLRRRRRHGLLLAARLEGAARTRAASALLPLLIAGGDHATPVAHRRASFGHPRGRLLLHVGLRVELLHLGAHLGTGALARDHVRLVLHCRERRRHLRCRQRAAAAATGTLAARPAGGLAAVMPAARRRGRGRLALRVAAAPHELAHGAKGRKKGHIEVALLERHLRQRLLLARLEQDVLLHRGLGDEPVDVHVARLANAVRAVLRLRVHGGVPVAVVEDHRVGALQVDAQPAGARRQDEAEDARVAVEAVHHALALLDLGRAVEAQVRVALQRQELLQHVEHARHLRENEASVAASLALAQQAV